MLRWLALQQCEECRLTPLPSLFPPFRPAVHEGVNIDIITWSTALIITTSGSGITITITTTTTTITNTDTTDAHTNDGRISICKAERPSVASPVNPRRLERGLRRQITRGRQALLMRVGDVGDALELGGDGILVAVDRLVPEPRDEGHGHARLGHEYNTLVGHRRH